MTVVNFEEALKRLEEIVRDLEQGDLALEEALKLFEEGMQMSRICTEKLTAAREKLQTLTRSEDGTIESVPFDEDRRNGEA